MAQSLPTLNPPNALKNPKHLTPTNNQSSLSFCPSSSRKAFPRMKNSYPSISAASATPSNQQQKQNSAALEALISGERKEDAMAAIKTSLSNCLSETHLDLTVPGLKSKTRGKVIPNTRLQFVFYWNKKKFGFFSASSMESVKL